MKRDSPLRAAMLQPAFEDRMGSSSAQIFRSRTTHFPRLPRTCLKPPLLHRLRRGPLESGLLIRLHFSVACRPIGRRGVGSLARTPQDPYILSKLSCPLPSDTTCPCL